MKTLLKITIITLLVPTMALAQIVETDAAAQAEIKKLSFLVGNWQGSGWMMGQDGSRHSFEQTENVGLKLDGTALLIEGQGRAEGRVVHNALAIITFNSNDSNYSFFSYLANGRKGDFKGELIDGTFYWYLNEGMRYVITINQQGEWFEKGEMNRGGNWFEFFEMTLRKK